VIVGEERQQWRDHPLIEVEDIDMTVSALSTNRHWVAYTSIVYQ
jgi:MEMO1 family protein